MISIPFTLNFTYFPAPGYKFDPVKVTVSPYPNEIAEVRSVSIIGVAAAV